MNHLIIRRTFVQATESSIKQNTIEGNTFIGFRVGFPSDVSACYPILKTETAV
jgi:hypothetical protein